MKSSLNSLKQYFPSSTILLSDIVYPYRPDILLRIDFLEWFEQNKAKYFNNDKTKFTYADIVDNKDFFIESMGHPFFLQFTRKRKYRRLNLSYKDSQKIYARGIVLFLNLLFSLKTNGFDINEKIGLYSSFIILKPRYGEKMKRMVYMGDGCHRLACYAWLNKKNELPMEIFNTQLKLLYRPVNSFDFFTRLNIFDPNDEKAFYDLFSIPEKLEFYKILEWTEKIRIKFRKQNITKLFDIKFSY